MGFFGNLFGKGQGQKCVSCKRKVQGRDSLMASQSVAIQAGLSQHARDLGKNQGYVCSVCGRIYCKTCLEKHVLNPQRGAVCPACGGSFVYLA